MTKVSVDVDDEIHVDVDVDGVEEADVAETGDGDEAGVVVDGDDVNCDAVGVRDWWLMNSICSKGKQIEFI